MAAQQPGDIIHYDPLYVKKIPVKGGVTVNKGKIGNVDANGFAQEFDFSPVGDADMSGGWFQFAETIDNLSGQDGDVQVQVLLPGADMIFRMAGIVNQLGLVKGDDAGDMVSAAAGAIGTSSVIGRYSHKAGSHVSKKSAANEFGVIKTGVI